MKRSEPGRAPLEKASPGRFLVEPGGPMSPLILNFICPLNLRQEPRKGPTLELLAQPNRQPSLHHSFRLTTLPRHLFFLSCVFYALGLYPAATSVDPDQIPTSQKMAPCIVAHLNQTLIFTVVKVI